MILLKFKDFISIFVIITLIFTNNTFINALANTALAHKASTATQILALAEKEALLKHHLEKRFYQQILENEIESLSIYSNIPKLCILSN